MNEAALAELRKDVERIIKLSANTNWDQHPNVKEIGMIATQIHMRIHDASKEQATPEVPVEEVTEQEVPEDEDPEAKRRKRNEKELEEKPAAIEARGKAGEYVMEFGVHKNKRLKDVPRDYIMWILGVKQAGKEFRPLPASQTSWLRANQPGCLLAAQQFMTWRCWACFMEDSRFKNGKLCTSCWHTLG